MIRRALLAAADSDRLRDVAAGTPVSRDVVRRFVAGEGTEDAVEATRRLLADGLLATIDHLGEDTTDLAQAEATRDAYLSLLGRLADEGLTSGGRGQRQAVGGRSGAAGRRGEDRPRARPADLRRPPMRPAPR